MMKLPDDASNESDGFFGVVSNNKLNTIDDAERPKSPEMFVGRENSKTPRVPRVLPADADPKIYEKELNRTKHTYEKKFVERNVVAFENWGIRLVKKKVHTGWALKKMDD